jgi:hypothetical protein
VAPAAKYVVTPNRASQLEGQKQGIARFSFTGAHDILERTTKNTEQWVKLRFALWYWRTSIGNVFKTCHDAADTKFNGKIKERRRSGKVNTVAHEVYGPGNQLNVADDGSEADGTGLASNRNLRTALQALAFQLAWDVVMAHLVPGYMMQRAITLAAGFTTNPLTVRVLFRQQVLHAAWRPSSPLGSTRIRYQEICHLGPIGRRLRNIFRSHGDHLGELPAGKARRSQRRRLRVFGIR